MLATVRRGPFAAPTQEEKIEFLLTRMKKSDAKVAFADHALEHTLSFQRRVRFIKQDFLKRGVPTPLGITQDTPLSVRVVGRRGGACKHCERVRITCTCADRKAAVAMEVGRERSLTYNELGCRGMGGNAGQLRAYHISRISGIALRPSSAEPFMRIFWYGTVSGNLRRSGRCCHRTPELSRVTGPSKGHSVRRCRLRYSSRRRISTIRATS